MMMALGNSNATMIRRGVKAIVVGGGSIGTRHAKNLAELGVEVAMVDRDETVRNKISSDLGVPAYLSVSTAIEAESPDLAVIATPNANHINAATISAKAGCHLFIEKPLSDKMSGIDALQSIINSKGLVTMVGCNLRFHPEIKKVRELLNEGVIGNVVAARIEGGSYLPDWFPESDYRRKYSAREDLGGGVMLDYIHEINYARWLLGDFHTVSAFAGQRTSLDIETNDIAGILIETTSGAICEVHLDYIQQAYSRSCHIIGEEGTIRWSWQDECVEWTTGDAKWQSFERPSGWETNEMYVEELRHFLNSIETRELTTCSIECGRRDLEIVLAARKSAIQGEHVNI